MYIGVFFYHISYLLENEASSLFPFCRLWSVDGTVIQYSNEYSNNWNICNIFIVLSDIGILGRNAQPVKTAIHVSNCRKPTFLSVQATSQL